MSVPGVDAEEGQLAHVRVGRDLEGQGAERLAVVQVRRTSAPVPGSIADHRRHVERRRQVVDDRVEHRLHALVLQGGAGQDGHDPVRAGCRGAGRAPARRSVISSPSRYLCISSSSISATASTSVWRCFSASAHEVGRDLGDVDLVAEVVAVEIAFISIRSIMPWNCVLAPDRDLDRHGVRAEAVLDHLHAAPEVGAGAVHLVDEADARDAVSVGLAPDGLGLRLDAGDGVEDDDPAVEHAEAPLDLDREVDVAGRIDDVDAMSPQKQVVAAAVIVIPRSCSWAIQSMVAAPSWTSPSL